jgi:hypothetical protein
VVFFCRFSYRVCSTDCGSQIYHATCHRETVQSRMAAIQLRNQHQALKSSRESTPSSGTPLRQEPPQKQEVQEVKVKAEEVVDGVPESSTTTTASNTTTPPPQPAPRAIKEESPSAGSSAAESSATKTAEVSDTMMVPEQADSGSETDEGGLVVTSLLPQAATDSIADEQQQEQAVATPESLTTSLGKRKAEDEPDEAVGNESRRIKAETD